MYVCTAYIYNNNNKVSINSLSSLSPLSLTFLSVFALVTVLKQESEMGDSTMPLKGGPERGWEGEGKAVGQRGWCEMCENTLSAAESFLQSP